MTNEEINVKCAKAMGWKLVSYDEVPATTKEDYESASRNDGWVWDGRDSDKEAWQWNPSESIADAWVLVEYVTSHDGEPGLRGKATVERYGNEWRCWLWGSGCPAYSTASTAPLAICLAFLEWANEASPVADLGQTTSGG